MRVEIDLSAIRENVKMIAKATGKEIILMCKADAYGHGLSRVAREVPSVLYGVATEEEGLILRQMEKSVLITAPSVKGLALAKRYDMIPMIGDDELVRQAISVGLTRCHIKINSGMNRFGFRGEKACYQAAKALIKGGVRVEGIATHYLEEKDQTIKRQNRLFDNSVLAIRHAVAEEGGSSPVTHVTGSGALFAKNYDYLRVGLPAYGYHAEYTAGIPLVKAMKVSGEILTVKYLRKGDTLGYGGIYRAGRNLVACTVLGGYGDGVTREEVGRKVLLRGKNQRIAAVCMDSFEMIAEGMIPRVGERVILLSDRLDAAYIAAYRKSIPYAVLLGYDVPRAERIYHG